MLSSKIAVVRLYQIWILVTILATVLVSSVLKHLQKKSKNLTIYQFNILIVTDSQSKLVIAISSNYASLCDLHEMNCS